MIILDIFKYFASFVPKDALRRTFRAPDGKQYRALMDEVLSSGADWVQDGITDFIFGTDADKLATVITSVTGIYLFVEYDRVSSTIDAATDRKDDRFHVAAVDIPLCFFPCHNLHYIYTVYVKLHTPSL